VLFGLLSAFDLFEFALLSQTALLRNGNCFRHASTASFSSILLLSIAAISAIVKPQLMSRVFVWLSLQTWRTEQKKSQNKMAAEDHLEECGSLI
jgi:hypothetical protein